MKNINIIINHIKNKNKNNKIMKDNHLIKRYIINIKMSNKIRVINNNIQINLKDKKDKDKIIIKI
jgi:hypothetical protein